MSFGIDLSGMLIAEETNAAIRFESSEGKVVILSDLKPLATYIYHDEIIPRPYFAHIHAANGPQISRNHPPQPGDADDHKLFHPGLWFALGDINGSDCWRLKARVETTDVQTHPQTAESPASLSVKNTYYSDDGQVALLKEVCRYQFLPQNWGTLWTFDTTLTAIEECRFGDQMEEMGLGFRMATPLVVNSMQGGRVLNSQGGINEKETATRLADWCDYGGKIDGVPVGVSMFAAPDNPRQTWWHVRDYGFFTANPFHAHPERTVNQAHVLKKGESVRFRYGIAIHRDHSGITYDPASTFQQYRDSLQEK